MLDYGLDLIGQSFDIELDLPDNTTALSSVLRVIGDNKVSHSKMPFRPKYLKEGEKRRKEVISIPFR